VPDCGSDRPLCGCNCQAAQGQDKRREFFNTPGRSLSIPTLREKVLSSTSEVSSPFRAAKLCRSGGEYGSSQFVLFLVRRFLDNLFRRLA
jgi:hypothetical protein